MAPKSHGDDVVSSTSAVTIDWPWIDALDADHLGQVDIAKVVKRNFKANFSSSFLCSAARAVGQRLEAGFRRGQGEAATNAYVVGGRLEGPRWGSRGCEERGTSRSARLIVMGTILHVYGYPVYVHSRRVNIIY